MEAEPEEPGLVNKMFRLRPEAIRAFDILKAEQGSRSGPRLAAEAIDLLLMKYGKPPIEPTTGTASTGTSAPPASHGRAAVNLPAFAAGFRPKKRTRLPGKKGPHDRGE